VPKAVTDVPGTAAPVPAAPAAPALSGWGAVVGALSADRSA